MPGCCENVIEHGGGVITAYIAILHLEPERAVNASPLKKIAIDLHLFVGLNVETFHTAPANLHKIVGIVQLQAASERLIIPSWLVIP